MASYRAARSSPLVAEARGEGVYEVTATLTNNGRWPPRHAISQRSRRFPAPRLVLELGDAELVAGEAHLRADELTALGSRQTETWLVAAPAGTTLRLTLSSDFAGRDNAEVTL